MNENGEMVPELERRQRQEQLLRMHQMCPAELPQVAVAAAAEYGLRRAMLDRVDAAADFSLADLAAIVRHVQAAEQGNHEAGEPRRHGGAKKEAKADRPDDGPAATASNARPHR